MNGKVTSVEKEIEQVYGNKIRVRACGLCWEGDTLLVANHLHLGPAHFWAPPGGGVELWASAEETLKREFREETGLEIEVGPFQFTCEFIQPPLHAIELFFEVKVVGGRLFRGLDPETKLQVISAVEFKSFKDILSFPSQERHGIFAQVHSPFELRNLRGYVRLL